MPRTIMPDDRELTEPIPHKTRVQLRPGRKGTIFKSSRRDPEHDEPLYRLVSDKGLDKGLWLPSVTLYYTYDQLRACGVELAEEKA